MTDVVASVVERVDEWVCHDVLGIHKWRVPETSTTTKVVGSLTHGVTVYETPETCECGAERTRYHVCVFDAASNETAMYAAEDLREFIDEAPRDAAARVREAFHVDDVEVETDA